MIPIAEPDGRIALHPLLAAAFDRLEGTGVRWCLLRVPTRPDAPTGDVDLLVARADFGKARLALRELRFAPLPGVGSGSEAMFFNYHPQTDRWLCLHIVTELGFGDLYACHSGVEASCLQRRCSDGALIRAASGDEFWVTLLHCLLDKRVVPERHRLGLRALVQHAHADDDWGRVVDRSCPQSWTAARMLTCVAQGCWDELERFAPTFERSWRSNAGAGARLEHMLRRVSLLPKRMWNAFRRRGLSMAILGPDGAGKSTLVEGVMRSFCRPVRSMYMGFGGGGTPPLLTRLRLPGIGAPGHLLVLWWQSLRALWLRLRGYLVVFDRYSYDTLASPPQHHQSLLSRLGSWVKAHSCPPPHLIVVLDAPGKLMFERKGELSVDILEAQRQRYLALADRFAQVRIVDATQPPAAVRIEVLDHLWNVYRDHWN